jgi:hypothetical protein
LGRISYLHLGAVGCFDDEMLRTPCWAFDVSIDSFESAIWTGVVALLLGDGGGEDRSDWSETADAEDFPRLSW